MVALLVGSSERQGSRNVVIHGHTLFDNVPNGASTQDGNVGVHLNVFFVDSGGFPSHYNAELTSFFN